MCQVRQWELEFSWDHGPFFACGPAPFPDFLPLLGLCPTKKGKRQLRADCGVWEKTMSSAGPVPMIHPAARDSPPLGKSLFFFFFKGKQKLDFWEAMKHPSESYHQSSWLNGL